MKTKLFLGIGLIASLVLMFFAVENDNLSVFKASLLESPQKEASVEDWKTAFTENDITFFTKNIQKKNRQEFLTFVEEFPLKMDITVKKIVTGEVFFSFFGAKEGSNVLHDNNYGYMGENFLLLSPAGTFERDPFNTALLKNSSDFPFFLDGEYLAIAESGDESEAMMVSLSEVEKNYILPGELFTLDIPRSDFSQLKNIEKIESITYGFTLSLSKK